jgi:alpha-L-rhamnosidase
MKSTLFILTLLLTAFIPAATAQSRQGLAVADLRTEYLNNPVGTGAAAPRFFWKITSDRRNTAQTAYELRVSRDPAFRDRSKLVFSSGKQASGASVQVPCEGPAPESQTRYYWQVRVWDNHGRVSPWSAAAFWETGLLKAEEWKAEWIEPAWPEDYSRMQPAPMMRTEFPLRRKVASARVYISSRGLYELYLNGQRVGHDYLTPGWTSYHNRIQYQTYDVTGLLRQGANAAGVQLGDGWYRGNIGFSGQRSFYGQKLALIAQIAVRYDDGSTEIIGTGPGWKATTGPIRHSDIYEGEYYDAQLELPGWTTPGFDDSGWKSVAVANHPKNTLIAPQGPPVRKIQELKPVSLLVTPEGDQVFDMGQNMVGWVRLQVQGPKGTKVVIRHAEVLDKKGNFYTVNLRAADQTNTYVLKGGGVETWEPRFTFQGFRYVAVEGYPGTLTTDAITGVVLHSDMEPTGLFDSSHPLLNRLQHNIVWGQKGNFVDVPTDCPQRDERLGWTGDAQVFAPTANTNMNTAAFFTKWLGDVSADQTDAGAVPHVVPNVLGPGAAGAAGWADAATIVPWAMYEYYGDLSILERQYGSMKKWVEYMKARAARLGDPYIWSGDFHFGDWLSFNTTRSDYPGAYTERDMLATAYFAHSTDLLIRTAKLLGNDQDAATYTALLQNIKKSFQDEFVTPRGRVISDTQTSHLLALQYDLLPGALRPLAADQLLRNVQQFGHLTTGFLGTPHLNHVLSEFGHYDQAYALLMRQEYPSWLYPVTRDATTIWERWDGIKPDSSFQDAGMNSYNHYAYGAIGEWMVKTVAGIRAIEPGYRSIRIAPMPGGGLSQARAIQHTLYGEVLSAWHFDGADFVLEAAVPANCRAEIALPFAAADRVLLDGKAIATTEGMQVSGSGEKGMTVSVGSGRYLFRYPAAGFPESARPGSSAAPTAPAFSRDSRLADLLAIPASRKVLFDELPALMQSPWLSQVMGFSLQRSMECLPPALRATEQKLAAVEAKLKAIQ